MVSRKICWVMVILWALIPGIAWSADDNLAALKNIQAMVVVVEDIKPGAIKDGLNKDKIETDVSAMLRDAGIAVTPQGLEKNSSTVPQLIVAINTLRDQDGLYAFAIELSVKQRVTLTRTGDSLMADTWSIDAVGSIGSVRLNTLRTFVKSGVEKLIADWRSANEK